MSRNPKRLAMVLTRRAEGRGMVRDAGTPGTALETTLGARETGTAHDTALTMVFASSEKDRSFSQMAARESARHARNVKTFCCNARAPRLSKDLPPTTPPVWHSSASSRARTTSIHAWVPGQRGRDVRRLSLHQTTDFVVAWQRPHHCPVCQLRSLFSCPGVDSTIA